jgi:uncharacterized protein (DUF1330 family)
MPAYMLIESKVTDRERYIKYVETAQPLAGRAAHAAVVRACPT